MSDSSGDRPIPIFTQDNVLILPTEAKSNQEASVSVLEHMLALAKEGKVAACAIAFVRADRISASWSWSSSDCAPALVGSVSGMQVALVADAFLQRKPLPA